MAEQELHTRIALRRGLLSSYSATEVPYKGEVCFVDNGTGQLTMKVGDGSTDFQNLPDVSFGGGSTIVQGYYDATADIFYADAGHTTPIVGQANQIYVDLTYSSAALGKKYTTYICQIAGGITSYHKAMPIDDYVKIDGSIPMLGLTVTGTIETNKLKLNNIAARANAVVNVLTQNLTDNSVQKRSADKLLEDIGGYSCKLTEDTSTNHHTLILKVGKQS